MFYLFWVNLFTRKISRCETRIFDRPGLDAILVIISDLAAINCANIE